ncbi:hypothetical protein ACHQM5_004657 [Ranunculus cassubicifolius]
MAANLLLRPSIHPPPKTLKQSLSRFPSSLINPNNLTFNHQKTAPIKALSITNQSSPQTLKPQFLTNSPKNTFKSSHSIICHASYETVPATDRLISILSYFIPFLGGLSYGYHLFAAFPMLEYVFNPLVPIVGFYKSIPHANLLTFMGLYVGIVRDRKFSRYARFNALQALFLEFLMVVPSLLNLVFTGEGIGFKLIQGVHSTVFVALVAYFLYTVGFCLFGKIPRFPYVTDAMDSRLNLEDGVM